MPVVRWKAPRRVAALAVAASATVLFAAACGSGSGDSTSNDGGTGGNNALTAYTDCLRENGVTLALPSGGARNRPSGQPRDVPSGAPRPSGSAGERGGGGQRGGGFPGGAMDKPAGVDDATWQKAQEACASVRPSGRPGGNPGGGTAADAAYHNCLRDHGVTLSPSLSTSDPAVSEATAACEVLRPSPSATPTT